jgi:hypothetical protein
MEDDVRKIQKKSKRRTEMSERYKMQATRRRAEVLGDVSFE